MTASFQCLLCCSQWDSETNQPAMDDRAVSTVPREQPRSSRTTLAGIVLAPDELYTSLASAGSPEGTSVAERGDAVSDLVDDVLLMTSSRGYRPRLVSVVGHVTGCHGNPGTEESCLTADFRLKKINAKLIRSIEI